MAVTKNVSFRGPYVGRTFQTLAKDALGGDGYLEGATSYDDNTNITVGPYAFVQSGIVCHQDGSSTIPVPSGPQPWFVIVSTVDDDPATGVTLSATSDLIHLGTAVVLAYKMAGRWSNPFPVSTAGVRAAAAAETGRESGLRPVPSIAPGSAGNALTAMTVGRGVAVDSRGERRELGSTFASLGAAVPAAAAMTSFAPLSRGSYDRNDYLVLRRRLAGAELVVAQGGGVGQAAQAQLNQIDTGAQVTRPSAWAKRGGVTARVASAWGNGTALKLTSGLNVSTAGGTTTGIVNPMVAYTGSVPIGNVVLLGPRPSDQALLIVFTEGNQVKVGAFSSKDGSVVNAPVRIDAQPNACTNASATLDGDGALHVVYQHDEGTAAPSQQVYYTKRSVAAGTFAAAALTPRLVNGVLSTKNDTFPSIGTDRRGRVHIAYATGNGSDTFGQLRYVVLDDTGGAISRTTVAQYGQQADFNGPPVVSDATSLVANIRQPKVVVTPHDEVDILMLVTRAGAAGPDELAVYSPGFAARLGFPIVLLSKLFPASGAGTDTLQAASAVADELGQLLVFAAWMTAGIEYARLDTVLAPLGRLADSYLERSTAAIAAVTALKSDVGVALGAAGELLFGFVDGTNVQSAQCPARSGGRAPTPHPHDVLLGGWEVDAVDKEALADPTVPDTAFEVFNVRPKRMSYPVLVGDDGDYQGYGALLDALAVANRKGGHVVLRGGSHRPSAPLVLGSGVRLEGEGHALLDCPLAVAAAPGWLQLGQMAAPLQCAVAGQTVTVSGGPSLRGVVHNGDVCELFDGTGASTGLFRVRRVLDDTRFVTDGAPAGATVLVYACGVELSNVTIAAETEGASGLLSSVVAARGLYGGVIERVKLVGALGANEVGLRLSLCRETTVRNVDVLSLAGAAGAYGIRLDNGHDNAVERALIGSASGSGLLVEITEANPRLIDCGSSQTTPASILINAGRSSPVFMAGCTARVDGDATRAVTPVGKVLSSVSGGAAPAGALQFQDENTQLYQGGAPLELTAPSAAGAAFNGATPKLIVPSVNERLLRAGDTMTGELGVPSLLLSEWSTLPATPAAGQVRLLLQSNGLPAGQTPPVHRSQLVMLMASGETLILAQTDPT